VPNVIAEDSALSRDGIAPLPGLRGALQQYEKRANPHRPRPLERPKANATDRAVEIYPPDNMKRRGMAWNGMATVHERIEFRFHSPLHLLALCEEGMRMDGDTFVEGVPRSGVRDLTQKFTFVQAGHAYCESQEPRVLTRIVYSISIRPRCRHIPELALHFLPWPRGSISRTRHCGALP
jgi:AraC family transcriptional regulator